MHTQSPTEVPRLRFPEFTSKWDYPLLESVAVRGSGHTPDKNHPEYYNGDIQWISLADSKNLDQGYIETTKSRISELGLRNSSAVLHPPETVIVSRDAGVGKSAVLKHSMAVSQHFIVWRPIDGVSSSWYIYYWLQIHKSEFERIAIGSTIKTIGLPYFKKLRIPFPSLPEQRKIADFLTAVDGRIQQLSQKRALLQDYKKGVMQQLFTQALRFKDDHGNDFPDWKEKTLGDVSAFINGRAYKHNELLKEGPYPVLRVGNFFTNPEWYYSDLELPEDKYCDTGDLLYAWSASFGPRIWSGGKVIYHYHIWKVLPSQKITKLFLFHLLDWDVERIKNAQGNGIAMMHVTKQAMEERPFSLPCVEEQTNIANFLTALDRKIESVAHQIAHTQTFKRGLLQQMFV